MRILLIILTILSWLSSYSQRITYDTTFNGWKTRVTYDPSADSVAGFIFHPGAGEITSNQYSDLRVYGPHYWIANGWDGTVTLGNGVHYPIFVTILSPSQTSFPSAGINTTITAILNRYKIKRNARYFLGLSRGGRFLDNYVTYKATQFDYTYYNRFKAGLSMMAEVPNDVSGATISYPEKFGNAAARGGLRMLLIQQQNDGVGSSGGQPPAIIRDRMNDSMPGSAHFIWSNFGTGGHSNWNDMMNPSQTNWTSSNPNLMSSRSGHFSNFIAGGQNVWQWLMRQGDTSAGTLPPIPCKAVAGDDQTIIRTEASSAVLDGSLSEGIGLSYSWKLITSVSQDYIGVVKSGNKSVAYTHVLPYHQNGYEYELTVSDVIGCTSKDTVKIVCAYGTLPPQSTDGAPGYHLATATDTTNINATNGVGFCKIGDLVINGARGDNIGGSVFTSIQISSAGYSLGPGQKVLIKAGRYRNVNILFNQGQAVGSLANPIIITPYDGQLECQNMVVRNLVKGKVTGQYIPNVSGHSNYRGHENGDYSFSDGTYGIYINNGWSNLHSGLLSISGEYTDSVEVSYIEMGNGGFAGVICKQDGGTSEFDGHSFHDLYIHDIHGEGVYFGYTGSGYRHGYNNLKFYNNRIINAGNEILQINNQGVDCVIENNVLINSACNWKSNFQGINQDLGPQMTYRNGRNRFQYNISLGNGTQTINYFNSLHESQTPNGDTIHVAWNLFKYGRGRFGPVFNATTPIPGITTFIHHNLFGDYQFRGQELFDPSYIGYTNSSTLVTQNGTYTWTVRDITYDTSKAVFKTSIYIDTSRITLVNHIPDPKFVNSGWPDEFSWNYLSTWADTIHHTWHDEHDIADGLIQEGAPVIFKQGDYIIWLGKYYRSLVNNNHANMPIGQTNAYWELLTWQDGINIRNYPPNDYRLREGDIYRNQGMGLKDLGPGEGKREIIYQNLKFID